MPKIQVVLKAKSRSFQDPRDMYEDIDGNIYFISRETKTVYGENSTMAKPLEGIELEEVPSF